jgi:hypothetical protein
MVGPGLSNSQEKPMKSKGLSFVALTVLLFVYGPSLAVNSETGFPEFEFDVWASPPSRQVYSLTAEPVVQRILYSVKEEPLPVEVIAARIDAPPEQVQEKLNQLTKFGLAGQKGQAWISNVPLYTNGEMQVAEELGKRYAEKEAKILREAIPAIERVFQETVLSRYFAWDEVSLVLVGGLVSDFCVVDRIPFMAEYYTEALQPPLVSPSGKRWGYNGFEKLPKRFPSRRWKFYHNQFSKWNGGLARFGYIRENRSREPSRPEGWIRFEQGKILFALAEGPRTFSELQQQTGLKADILHQGLDMLQGIHPPAVVLHEGRYRSRIPVLCEKDLALLLAEGDRIAAMIFQEVVRPLFEERVAKGKALGSRWPLPADTYVRDKALQILIEEGRIGPAPTASVDWNFSFWGWKGFLAMHDDIRNNVTPDPFLLTSISESEAERLAQFNRRKQKVLGGDRLADISTPAHAFLTWISAYANCDLDALKLVETQTDHLDMAQVENLRKRGWFEYIGGVNIRRLPPVSGDPKDGDVHPVLTGHERGFEEAYVFFYWDGGWRYLGNTPMDGRWHTWAVNVARDRVGLLRR